MSDNRLQQLLRADASAIGTWSVLDSHLGVEVLATEGYDFVVLDCQHGPIGFPSIIALIAACARTNTTPLVRVSANDPAKIGRSLDGGAEGVIIPMVESREQAASCVAASRYPPKGIRSYGPFRSGMYLDKHPTSDVNERVLCLPMIETETAVRHAEEICSTPGVDGVFIGAVDLALSMGTDNATEKRHASAIMHVLDASNKAQIGAGIHARDGDEGRRYLDMGFRMVTVSTDLGLLRRAAQRELEAAKGRNAPLG